MCLLCDDEKAYQAYMNYLDAMERQGKAADPDKAMDAVLDQLKPPTRRAATTRPTTRHCLRSSAARLINDGPADAEVRSATASRQNPTRKLPQSVRCQNGGHEVPFKSGGFCVAFSAALRHARIMGMP
jgi:hypothetical protein